MVRMLSFAHRPGDALTWVNGARMAPCGLGLHPRERTIPPWHSPAWGRSRPHGVANSESGRRTRTWRGSRRPGVKAGGSRRRGQDVGAKAPARQDSHRGPCPVQAGDHAHGCARRRSAATAARHGRPLPGQPDVAAWFVPASPSDRRSFVPRAADCAASQSNAGWRPPKPWVIIFRERPGSRWHGDPHSPSSGKTARPGVIASNAQYSGLACAFQESTRSNRW